MNVFRLSVVVLALAVAGCGGKGLRGLTEPAKVQTFQGETLPTDDRFRDALRPALVATGYKILGAKFAKIVQAPDGTVRACGRYRYTDNLNRQVRTPFAMVGTLQPDAFVAQEVALEFSPAVTICRSLGL